MSDVEFEVEGQLGEHGLHFWFPTEGGRMTATVVFEQDMMARWDVFGPSGHAVGFGMTNNSTEAIAEVCRCVMVEESDVRKAITSSGGRRVKAVARREG